MSTDLIAVQEQSFGFSNADFLPVQEKALSYMSRIILFQAFPLKKKKKKDSLEFLSFKAGNSMLFKGILFLVCH